MNKMNNFFKSSKLGQNFIFAKYISQALLFSKVLKSEEFQKGFRSFVVHIFCLDFDEQENVTLKLNSLITPQSKPKISQRRNEKVCCCCPSPAPHEFLGQTDGQFCICGDFSLQDIKTVFETRPQSSISMLKGTFCEVEFHRKNPDKNKEITLFEIFIFCPKIQL